MWGSILGGLIGAVVGALTGGAVTYYRERRLEEKRKHEEAIKELGSELDTLRNEAIKSYLSTRFPDMDVMPGGVRSRALNILAKASDLNDDELKEKIIDRLLVQEYNSFTEMEISLSEVWRDTYRSAYPELAEALEENEPYHLTPFFGDRQEDDENWYGPASMDFVERIDRLRND